MPNVAITVKSRMLSNASTMLKCDLPTVAAAAEAETRFFMLSSPKKRPTCLPVQNARSSSAPGGRTHLWLAQLRPRPSHSLGQISGQPARPPSVHLCSYPIQHDNLRIGANATGWRPAPTSRSTKPCRCCCRRPGWRRRPERQAQAQTSRFLTHLTQR